MIGRPSPTSAMIRRPLPLTLTLLVSAAGNRHPAGHFVLAGLARYLDSLGIPDAIPPVAAAISPCGDSTFGWSVGDAVGNLVWVDSVAGSDILSLRPPDDHFPARTLVRYADALGRLATPYTVDTRRHATRSSYVATTL